MVISENDFRNLYKLQKFADMSIKRYHIEFPIEPNANLAKIVAFLTFDGHLTPTNKMFIFSAGSADKLSEIRQVTEEEFNVTGQLRRVITNNLGTSYEYRVCCQPIGRILELLGVPKGAKVFQKFDVPIWIKSNKNFSYEYLKTAFECEGSIWKESTGRVQIAFKINKIEHLMKDCEQLLKTMKSMLSREGIETTNIWSVSGTKRKDGYKTRCIQFRIKSGSIEAFINRFSYKNKIERGVAIDAGHDLCAKS